MKRLFGFGRKKKTHSKRLAPSASTPEEMHAKHAMFQYARNEFAQTVASGTSNDDGRGVLFVTDQESPSPNQKKIETIEEETHQPAVETTASFPSHEQQTQLQQQQLIESVSISASASGPSVISNNQSSMTPKSTPLQLSASNMSYRSSAVSTYEDKSLSHLHGQGESPRLEVPVTNLDPYSARPSNRYNRADSPNYRQNMPRKRLQQPFEPIMPDATYEEEYGDAYTGGPIKYIYPSGYQSMRPRSGPWKLSIVVCLLFTWLSVFIVGHCSDRVDQNLYYQYEIDDDVVVIETRWCGSRVLYLMWVISMLVTGLAAAYCSVIGYIKVRDFSVANSRSQPPGMVGKSDFYVQVDDTPAESLHPTNTTPYGSNTSVCHMPIYQADGTPQFWGGHIYRPTQAAVAITSR